MTDNRGWLGPKDGCTCSRRARKYHDSRCPCYNDGKPPAPAVDTEFLDPTDPFDAGAIVYAQAQAAERNLPPVFSARFESECANCATTMYVGDEVRADGQGGYEHASHGEDDAPRTQAPRCVVLDAAAPVAGLLVDVCPVCTIRDCAGCPDVVAALNTPPADDFDFEDAAPPAPPKPKFNVSGQPKPTYEWHGKQNRGYLVKDPRTGDFKRHKNGKEKGWTRATTFNKAASDQNALSEWGKRNVLIGAALLPSVVAKAHRMTHDDNYNELMSLVSQLETAAGAKVSSDWGTEVHEITERWDGGELTSLDDVPAVYRGALKLYIAALKEHQLRPVQGLIERTVFVPDFGGVVGTFDRVYLHEPSGQYLIGDVKTGKTLKYGMDEIETQEWLYARGINLYGVYDWNTHTWERARHVDSLEQITVSEQWGVVIHLPAQGDQAGTCNVVRADLQRGRRHAQVCHDVRVQRSNKPKPELFTGDLLMPAEPVVQPVVAADPWASWEGAFASVESVEHAWSMWESASAAGVDDAELDRLVGIAQDRLKSLGVHS